MTGITERGASASKDWPYEDADPVDVPVRGLIGECPDGKCACHPTGEGEPLDFTVLLCDEQARPMPHARCRVLHRGQVANEAQPNADAEGWITVTVPHPPNTVTLEWAPADTPLYRRYPFRKRYHVDLKEETGRYSLQRRLHNLGFSRRRVLEENVKEFQRAFGYEAITGDVEDIRPDLLKFHDEGGLPPLDGPESKGEDKEEEEGDDAGPGEAVPLLAFPAGPVAAKPKKPKKSKQKKAPVPRTPPAKKHKPAGGPQGAGTGTARPRAKGTLTLDVRSLFVQSPTAVATSCRWGNRKSHPVKGALIELFDSQGTVVVGAFVTANPAPKTNKLGNVTIKTGNLPDGEYVLKLNPPAGHELRGAMPGPITDPAVRDAQLRPVGPADAFFNDPPQHTRFRFLEVRITIVNGVLHEDKDKNKITLVKDMLHTQAVVAHGAAVRESESLLAIDWKPDWVQCGLTDGPKKQQADPSRPGKLLSPVHFIVLHHSDATTPGSTLDHFSDRVNNKDRAGAHYLVDVDGHVIKMMDETLLTNHAGRCSWYELESDPVMTRTAGFRWSDISVGIEQVHKYPDKYTSNMVVGTKNLIERIRSAYGTSPHNVLGHGEIALHGPLNAMRIGRKLTCPGEAYDWYILENSGNATKPGSGVVPHARYDAFFISNPSGALNSGSGRPSSVAVSGLQLTLSELGYFVKITGAYDEPTLRAVEAFQVRYFSGKFRSGQLPRIITKNVRLVNLVTIQMMHDVLDARAGFRF